MCTEKIQEKKIKKGGLWEQRLPGGCRAAATRCQSLLGVPGRLPAAAALLLCRGRRLGGSERPAQRAPAQGRALARLPSRGETEARGASGSGPWELGCLQVWAEGGSCVVLPSAAAPGRRCSGAAPPARPIPAPLPQGSGVLPAGSARPDPSPPVPQAGESSDTFSTFDVPIFTEEFLDQNKGEGLGGGAGAAASGAGLSEVGPWLALGAGAGLREVPVGARGLGRGRGAAGGQ